MDTAREPSLYSLFRHSSHSSPVWFTNLNPSMAYTKTTNVNWKTSLSQETENLLHTIRPSTSTSFALTELRSRSIFYQHRRKSACVGSALVLIVIFGDGQPLTHFGHLRTPSNENDSKRVAGVGFIEHQSAMNKRSWFQMIKRVLLWPVFLLSSKIDM